ncbi:DNA polymerase III subunit delta [Patescibacteria group bacterium]|nr:DNA polymerase III subunit delta [Patescibacteria group bacterium]MBU2259935.1 DNA polymerase III subunit delta [Patescibacteria group bacterium]
MSQVFLFFGDNQFALLEEKKRWVSNFIEKHGGENLLTLDAKGLTMRTLLDEVSVAPFIAGSRLVVVEGPIKCTKEEAHNLSKQIHQQVILLFVVTLDPSRRGKLPAIMKEIDKIADHRQFPRITRTRLVGWIDEECKSRGGSIAHDARDLLMEISGEDQGMLYQEIQKLCLYAQGKEITKQHVLDLAVTAGEREVWHLMDLLGAGKVEEGIKYAKGLLERGDSPYGLWSRLLWMISQLTLVWTAVNDGITNPASVAREVGVPFPTVRALLPCARKLDQASLTYIVDLITTMDRDLKTGAYRSTAEAPEELSALIDRCILAFK